MWFLHGRHDILATPKFAERLVRGLVVLLAMNVVCDGLLCLPCSVVLLHARMMLALKLARKHS